MSHPALQPCLKIILIYHYDVLSLVIPSFVWVDVSISFTFTAVLCSLKHFLKVKAGVCVQDHGLFAKERAEEQPRPPVKANDYSSSSESSESSEESESGEGAEEEESPTDR